MKVAEKRLFTALALIFVFTFSLMQMPAVYSEEVNVELEDDGLSIIADVIGLDLTKYDVEIYKHYAHSFDRDDPVRENIGYTLESSESKMRVTLTFINQTLPQMKC